MLLALAWLRVLVVLVKFTFPAAAALAQLEPAESRFRVVVPGQQPCLEDKHNVSIVFEMLVVLNMVVVVDVVVVLGLDCALVNGQFEPSESRFGVVVPGQQPCVDDSQNVTL